MNVYTEIHRIVPKPIKSIMKKTLKGKSLNQMMENAEEHTKRKLPSIKWGLYTCTPKNKPEKIWIRRSLCNNYQQTIRQNQKV